MDFRLTEEQELIRRNVREFAEKNIDPIAAEIDENSRHPVELFRKLAAGGWMGIPLPREYGGAGADFLTHAIVVEEIARSCSSTGFTLSFHAGIIGTTLNLFGSEEQKRKYLVPLAKGEHMAAFMLTEPQAGTDVMAVSTTAVRDGRGLRDRRDEDLRLQRAPCRHVHPVLLDGQVGGPQGHERLHRPEGLPGARAGKTLRQDGAPLVPDIGGRFQKVPGARRKIC